MSSNAKKDDEDDTEQSQPLSTEREGSPAGREDDTQASQTMFDPTQPMSQLIERPGSAASTMTARPAAALADTPSSRMAQSARLPVIESLKQQSQQSSEPRGAGVMAASTSALGGSRRTPKRRMTGPARHEGIKSMMFTGEVNQTFMQCVPMKKPFRSTAC